jgi:hypothetical protein
LVGVILLRPDSIFRIDPFVEHIIAYGMVRTKLILGY